MKKDRVYPQGAVVEELTDCGVTICRYVNTQGRLCANGYQAKRTKPSFSHYFANAQAREAFIATFVETARHTMESSLRYAEQVAREQAAMLETLQIGSIVYYTTSYEDTYAHFFQVTGKITKTRAIVRPLKHITTESTPQAMSGYAKPIVDDFDGPEQLLPLFGRKIVKLLPDSGHVSVSWYG